MRQGFPFPSLSSLAFGMSLSHSDRGERGEWIGRRGRGRRASEKSIFCIAYHSSQSRERERQEGKKLQSEKTFDLKFLKMFLSSLRACQRCLLPRKIKEDTIFAAAVCTGARDGLSFRPFLPPLQECLQGRAEQRCTSWQFSRRKERRREKRKRRRRQYCVERTNETTFNQLRGGGGGRREALFLLLFFSSLLPGNSCTK